jgi:hypothetical protein
MKQTLQGIPAILAVGRMVSNSSTNGNHWTNLPFRSKCFAALPQAGNPLISYLGEPTAKFSEFVYKSFNWLWQIHLCPSTLVKH